MTAETLAIPVTITVPIQLLRDVLCTAIEGGSNYWCKFSEWQRTPDLDYLSVHVHEHEASADDGPVNQTVTAEDLAVGISRLAHAAVQDDPHFPAAGRHLGNLLGENWDVETADVILQMTVFGQLVYG
jgi:hypothetical protein